MKIRPLHDRVVIKRVENETKTASGIVIPDNAAEKPDQGEVIAVGAGKKADDGKLIAMDVTSEASVTQALNLLLEREGRVDVVINNAGDGVAGSVEDTSLEEAQRQLDTNFFGVLRVCRAVLPAMRGSGRRGRRSPAP